MNKNKKKNNWKLSNFGKEVKMKLIEKDMSMSQLAKQVGTSRSFLSQILYENKKGTEYIQTIKMILDIEAKEEE